MDVVEHDLGFEAFGVGLEPLHEIGALYTFGIGGPIVHVGGGHQLPALGDAGDQDWVEVGACGIDGGGITGGTGAQDQDFGVFHVVTTHPSAWGLRN